MIFEANSALGRMAGFMWMSNIYIVINQKNSDKNTLFDLLAAVTETGATIVSVDEQNHLIEATTPAQEVSTIAAMEGVAYVRCLFNYIANQSPRQAA
ncbi:MAG TPA: hypothetical protein VGL72_18680 [Bryobacteraceae bacterium]|jgi:hypothetical protein